MKTILITGASGLVGRAVIQELITLKEEVTIYAASSNPDKIIYKADNFHVIKNEEIENILSANEIDILLQLAFPRNVSENQWAKGIKYAVDILFLAYKYKVKRVINVSSQSIYGLQRKISADEGHEICLNSPYTTGKYCTEVIMEHLFERGMYTNIRLSTTIGPDTKERVPNKLFARIVSGMDLIIKGGNQKFAFLDVRDAASGLVSLMRQDNIFWKTAYNLGTSEVNSLLDIANLSVKIARDYGYDQSRIVVQKDNIVMLNQIDVRLFECDFNWKAQHSLEESLRYIFEESYAHKTEG